MHDYIPLFAPKLTEKEARELPALALAFVGDGVQTLFERTLAALEQKKKPHELHRAVSRDVSATAQAEALRRVADLLTEEETDVFKRARNAKSGSAAKNAPIVDYRVASGYEAVVGYLYLTGKHARLDVLLNAAYNRVSGIGDAAQSNGSAPENKFWNMENNKTENKE